MDGACCFPIQPIYITEGRVMVARAVGNFGARSIGVIQTMDDTGKDLGAGVKMACEKLDLPCEIFQIRADAGCGSGSGRDKARQPDFVIVAAAQAAAAGDLPYAGGPSCENSGIYHLSEYGADTGPADFAGDRRNVSGVCLRLAQL